MPERDPPRGRVPTQTLSAADRQRMLGWESSKNHANDPTFGEKVKAMLDYGFAPLDTPEKRANVLKWSMNPNASYEDMPPGAMNVELPAGFVPFVGGAQALRDIWRDIKNKDVSGWTMVDAASLIPGIAAMGSMVGMVRHVDQFADMAKVWDKVEKLRAKGLDGEELLQAAVKQGIPEDQARRMTGLGVERQGEQIGGSEAMIGARGSQSKLPQTAQEWYDDLRRINPDTPRAEIEDAMRQAGFDNAQIRGAAQQAGEGHILDDLDQGLRSGNIPTALTQAEVSDYQLLQKTYREGFEAGMVGDELQQYAHGLLGESMSPARIQKAEKNLLDNPGPEPAHHRMARRTSAEIEEAGQTPERLLEIQRNMVERGKPYDEVVAPIRERRAAEQAAQTGRRAGDIPEAPVRVKEPDAPVVPSDETLKATLTAHERPDKVLVSTPVVGNESVKSLGAKIAGTALMPGATIDDAFQTAIDMFGGHILKYQDEIMQQALSLHKKWDAKLGTGLTDRFLKRYERGRPYFAGDWYETALPAAVEIFGPEKGKQWAKIWAYTSAGADAGGSNITYANKGLSQILLDLPVHTGRRPNDNNALLMRALSDVDTPLEVVHHAAKSGIAPAKLNDYSGNISHAGDRSIVDMWINRIATEQLPGGPLDDIGPEGYQVVQSLTERLAKETGEGNKGFQAGAWAGIKDEYGELGSQGLLSGGDLIRNHPGVQHMLPDEKTGILLPSFSGKTPKGPRMTYRQKYGIPALAGMGLGGAAMRQAGPGLLAPDQRQEQTPALFRGQGLGLLAG